MARTGLWTDPHGLENARAIQKVLDLEGILEENRMCLGDIIYKTLSEYSTHAARTAAQNRQLIAKNTRLRQRVLAGDYSNEQLAHVLNPYEEAKETAETIGKAVYSSWSSLFPKAKWLAGNWDKKVAKEVLGDALLEADRSELGGAQILGLSGGGSPPQQFLQETLYADYQETQTFHHKKWSPHVVEGIASGEVDAFFSHVPPKTWEDANHIDIAEEHLGEIVAQSYQKRQMNPNLTQEEKKKPITWFWGHKHRGSGVEFVEYSGGHKILSVTPGVAGFNHNLGSYGSFIIADFDDETKQLNAVDEYRIHTFHDGVQEVEHYATHSIDWSREKVNTTTHKKTVLKQDFGSIENHLARDKNYKNLSEGFVVDYSGLSVAQKDLQLTHNLAIANERAEQAGALAKKLITKARRDLVCGREEGSEVSFDEFNSAVQMIQNELAKEAARVIGVDISRLTSNPEDNLYRNIVINAAFGVNTAQVLQALHTDDLTVSTIASKWGQTLIGKGREPSLLARGTIGFYQQAALRNLKAEDFQGMAELHMPLNYERKRTFLEGDIQKAIDLWGQSWNSGLLTGKDLEATGVYSKKSDYTPNIKTREELSDMLGLAQLGIPEAELDEATSQQAIDNLRRGMQPLRDEEGIYIPVGEEKAYLPSQLEQLPNINPQTLQEALDSGNYQVVEGEDGTEYLINTRIGEESPLAVHNTQGVNYSALPREEFERQMLERVIEQRDQETDRLRNLYAQREEPESNPLNPLGNNEPVLGNSTGGLDTNYPLGNNAYQMPPTITSQPTLGRQSYM